MDNGYPDDIANKIADNMSEKGGYIFNQSHGYSYAVLCFETAYFKSHYPTYFFKALFNLNKNKAGAINKYILDAKLFPCFYPSTTYQSFKNGFYGDWKSCFIWSFCSF